MQRYKAVAEMSPPTLLSLRSRCRLLICHSHPSLLSMIRTLWLPHPCAYPQYKKYVIMTSTARYQSSLSISANLLQLLSGSYCCHYTRVTMATLNNGLTMATGNGFDAHHLWSPEAVSGPADPQTPRQIYPPNEICGTRSYSTCPISATS